MYSAVRVIKGMLESHQGNAAHSTSKAESIINAIIVFLQKLNMFWN